MYIQTKIILLFLTTFYFSLSSCMANPFQKSKLPKEMPEKVKMEFSENAGMTPEWKSIEISDNEIVISEKKMDDEVEKKWFAKISEEDKTNLYKVFVENKFDLIENEERKEIVYDAGSESIYISAGKVSKNVFYGMNSPLSRINLSRYSTVKKAIANLKNKYKSNAKEVIENFAIINYSSRKHNFIFKKAKRTKLNQTEIMVVEGLVEKAIVEYNKKQSDALKIKDLNKYKRQFIPVINEDGDKVIWANYFCETNGKWRKNILMVEDGGNCYFNLYVNLTQDTTYKLYVNGNA